LVDLSAFVLEASLENEGHSTIRKTIPQAELDFSAIAKGYGVDALGTLLEQSGIVDYFVEIGGEVRARGLRADGTGWRFGIERPAEGERTIHAVVNLRDASLATSGNYRNFYVRDGQKYVHTINPGTGYPEINSLLSASVISDDCMTADAYATAFMVMGFETASAFADSALGLEAFFIASGQADAFVEEATSGMAEVIER
jgi:thiamine biosynthesis lipoprotein